MGKLSKRISVNAICKEPARNINMRELHRAKRIVNEASYIAKEQLIKLIAGARAHSLWLHMSVLKFMFKFSAKQLIEFYNAQKEFYKTAIDGVSDKDIQKAITYVVNPNPKEVLGALGCPQYKFQRFDEDGAEYDRLLDTYSAHDATFRYNCAKRTVNEMQKAEMAAMFILHDKFGFRTKRLEKFVRVVRNTFRDGKCKAQENVAYLEHLCKRHFKEFDCIA